MRQDRTKAGKKTLQRSQTAENPRVAKWKSERRGWQLSNCRETDSCHMKTDIKLVGKKSEEEWADFVRKKPLEPFARDPATLTNCQREEDGSSANAERPGSCQMK